MQQAVAVAVRLLAARQAVLRLVRVQYLQQIVVQQIVVAVVVGVGIMDLRQAQAAAVL